MKTKLTITLVVFSAILSSTRAGTFTNLVLSSIQNQAVTNSFMLGTNQVAKVVNQSGSIIPNSYLAEVINGVTVVPSVGGSHVGRMFYGPSRIEFYAPFASPDPYTGLITLEINPAGTDLPIVPSNAVVIPADSAGPVTILLESSSDLVTWNAAIPGTYGTSTTNRFFRVRGIRN